MTAEIRIPSLGESVTEGVIVSWRKQDGDLVAPDEILLEIETDKASVEIPSETGGVLRILRREGETVAVGEVVARIETDRGRAHPGPSRPADGGAPAGEKARTQRVAATADETERPGERPPLRQVAAEVRATPEASKAAEPPRRGIGPLSPAVRRLVGEHDLDPTVIPATGRGGRLTAEDVRAYVTRQEEGDGAVPSPATVSVPPVVPPVAASHAAVPGTAAPTSRAAAPGLSTPGAADTGGTAVEERVPMGRIRKRIAERLVQAQHTAAILTTFNEIDMSAVLALRAEHRERFRERHGVDLGLLSFFARASIAALAEFPAINAEISGEDIVYKRFVHLGIAVGTPQGLVVPVLRHAERMSFADIEREIARLAARAREGKVSVDDLSGGTFTISNGGVYGSLLSTPILNPPQSGILGMHKIEKRPVVIDDQIVVRPMMYVALSYDHRIVDGEQAVTFLVRVKTRLEQPTRLLLDV